MGTRDEIKGLIAQLDPAAKKLMKERVVDSELYKQYLKQFSSPEHLAKVKQIAKDQAI